MRKICNKGHRIRASDKQLVYHFSIGTLLCWFSASHYLSGGTLCCLYGTDKTGNKQSTSRRYQLCGGIRVVCFIYCLCSRLHQKDK